jgi:hypothetical protein
MMNNVSNPRAMAQDAAAWYISNLDPHSSNESNIHRYLRTPLVALTVKTFKKPKPPAPIISTLGVAGDVLPGEVKEEKKCTGGGGGSNGGDWREYLQEEEATNSSMKNNERLLLQEEYASLSRRTKARLEAFLAGCTLAVPGPEEEEPKSGSEREAAMVSLQDGLSGFGLGSSPQKTTRTPPQRATSLTQKMGRSMIGRVPNPNSVKHPQIEQEDLVIRLELYIRTVQRVRNLKEECVVAMEPPKAVHARGQCITNAFVATAAYVRNISPVLTRLLHCLTMEMLAVECVAQEITKVIHRIVSEYEHGTSFASLAFLSTPEVNADSLLLPLILKYLKYLQADWERLVRECELERMLARAIDPATRKLFKTIEFQSIGHLLEVCHEYRSKLQNIELPPNLCAIAENVNTLCDNPEAVRQALRDLRREIITVNGHVLPPVASRKELLNLLTQTLNSRTLTSAPSKKKRSDTRRHKMLQKHHSAPSLIPHEGADSSSEYDASPEKDRKPPPKEFSSPDGISDMSGNESPSMLSISGYESSSAVDTSPDVRDKKAGHSKRNRRRSKFHLSTIDVLTRRLLIAASRTGNGGDAYFFV